MWPASSQDNLDRVGVENRSVDRYERRKRELRERFQSSRIFGVAIQRGEIGGHASEKKRWMKNADHEEEQIAVDLFHLELKKFVRAEQCQFQAGNCFMVVSAVKENSTRNRYGRVIGPSVTRASSRRFAL